MIGTPVINFATRGHGSVMENRLLGYYLRAGYRPRQVVFLDGVNERCEPDAFSAELSRMTERLQGGYRWEPAEPFRVLASEISAALGANGGTSRRQLSCEHNGRRSTLGQIVTRTLLQRDATCRTYRLNCQTFVQPFPLPHAHFDAHPAGLESDDLRELYAHLEPVWRQAGTTPVAVTLDGLSSHSWTDDAHYGPRDAGAIARAIRDHLPVDSASDSR